MRGPKMFCMTLPSTLSYYKLDSHPDSVINLSFIQPFGPIEKEDIRNLPSFKIKTSLFWVFQGFSWSVSYLNVM